MMMDEFSGGSLSGPSAPEHVGAPTFPDDGSATAATVLCCQCGVAIAPNPSMMCANCLRTRVDVTAGIPTQLSVHRCRGCEKWLRPGWIVAELESRELMALCLKKIKGLNKVNLVDATWIWTEPHSMRLKVQLTVQKEVVVGAVLQQSFVVEFVIRNQQCDDCAKQFTGGIWTAVVQVRQRVDHKRTFYYLEQLLLKHDVHSKALSIQSFRDGMDFYFQEKNQAVRFTDFLEAVVPVKIKHTKKLISADNHSNIFNHKFTHLALIAPLCKDDLVLLPPKLSKRLGNISPLVVVERISQHVHIVDPTSGHKEQFSIEHYSKVGEFNATMSSNRLIEYIVLGCEASLGAGEAAVVAAAVASSRRREAAATAAAFGGGGGAAAASSGGGGSGRKRQRESSSSSGSDGGGSGVKISRHLVEVEVARSSDLGVNDRRFVCLSQLGHILRVGDTVLGYDLTQRADLGAALPNRALPDVVLVRKLYSAAVDAEAAQAERRRIWKLRKLAVDGEHTSSADAAEGGTKQGRRQREMADAAEREYEQFLQQLDGDKEMRRNVNLYHASKQADPQATEAGRMAVDDAAAEADDEAVGLDELLDDLVLDDAAAPPDEEDEQFLEQQRLGLLGVPTTSEQEEAMEAAQAAAAAAGPHAAAEQPTFRFS